MSQMHLQKVLMTPTSAQSVDWLTGELDWGRILRSWVPTGFERYVRILHPAYIRIENETREVPVPWATVSEWSGKRLHATSHIQDLMLRADGHDWRRRGEGGSEPRQGELERTSLSCLLAHLVETTSTPNEIWMLIWFGYGGPIDTIGLPIEVSAQLTGSGRKYILRQGSIVPSPKDYEDSFSEHPPCFWWSTDRSWFAVCDIDAVSTYVGGSKELIEQILNDPSLEVFPADLDDPYDGLLVNDTIIENKSSYVPRRFRLGHLRHHFLFRFGGKLNSGVILYKRKRWWQWPIGRNP